jgi:hypothetical protein
MKNLELGIRNSECHPPALIVTRWKSGISKLKTQNSNLGA